MESRGVPYAIAAAALFGLSTPAAKLLLGDLSPLMLSGHLRSDADGNVDRAIRQWCSECEPGSLLLSRPNTSFASSEPRRPGRSSPGTSISGSITAANASLLSIPNVATVTAIASSKLLDAAMKERHVRYKTHFQRRPS